MYTKVPNAIATNAAVKATTAAFEYSFIVTVLAVGMKNACKRTVLAGGATEIVLVVKSVLPCALTSIQYRNL